MGKTRGKSDSKRSKNGTRSVEPEVFKDKQAENFLSFKKKKYDSVGKDNKTRNRAIDKGKIKVKPKQRTYTEKELGIPKLNTALNPVGVKVKGKKGKKFVDESKILQIIAEVNEETSAVNASKLEKARQLEEIREAKRKEMEERERQQQEKLERKKKEIKKKPQKGAQAVSEPVSEGPKRKRRVAFA